MEMSCYQAEELEVCNPQLTVAGIKNTKENHCSLFLPSCHTNMLAANISAHQSYVNDCMSHMYHNDNHTICVISCKQVCDLT